MTGGKPKQVMAVVGMVEDAGSADDVGRFAYISFLQQGLLAVSQARELVKGDIVDENHELPTIQRLFKEALEVS